MHAVRTFDLVQGESAAFATAEYYGCTVFAIVGPGKMVVGHLARFSGSICPLADPILTLEVLAEKISRTVELGPGG